MERLASEISLPDENTLKFEWKKFSMSLVISAIYSYDQLKWPFPSIPSTPVPPPPPSPLQQKVEIYLSV